MLEILLTKNLVLLLVAMAGRSRSTAGVYEIAKPGCPDECGGVKIPFPFGVGDGCYLSNNALMTPNTGTYRIKCDNSTTPPVPFLFSHQANINTEVLNINLDDHSIRVSSGVAYQCYSSNGETAPSTAAKSNYTLHSLWPFYLSTSRNMLVTIGCDVTAWIGDGSSDHSPFDATGCMASCYPSNHIVTDGRCSSGIGCCETSIPSSMERPSISVGSLYNHSILGDYNPCNYAFVTEVSSFNFSDANLTATAEDCSNIRVPVGYDWFVGLSISCSEAEKAGNGTLICGSNTQCVDADEGDWGYLCRCLDGYRGNPYLPHGCQDINECAEKLNDCERQEYCANTIGEYVCRCPHGHHGNGTRASPCIAPSAALLKIILGASITMGLMIGIIVIYGVLKLFQRRKEIRERKHNFKKNGGLLLQKEISSNEGVLDKTKIFSRIELEKATDNFNENRVLGHGGQGTVYKGMLVDGTIVAVKKAKKVDEKHLRQFINEVVILSQINHRNVVKLFGCCLETEVPMLVYEFIPNGTLYQHIHHPTEEFHMTWKVRCQIAVECAGAISYLHSCCSSPIYHRDIKSCNILLDEKYKAKISDFGTSRSISIDKTHVTTCIQGTFGYLDPEFFRSSHFSDKSDVYSFGVVILELLTSKKPILTYTDTDTDTEASSLAMDFIQLMETSPHDLHCIVDTQVLQECSEEEIETLANLIMRCLNLKGNQRPTMREVAMTLEKIKLHHDKEGDATIEQVTSSQEDCVWIVQKSLTNEGPYNPSITSTFTGSSYSAGVEDVIFDCN